MEGTLHFRHLLVNSIYAHLLVARLFQNFARSERCRAFFLDEIQPKFVLVFGDH